MKKQVLITGVARGIGKATCEKFLKEGYIVYGTFLSSEKEALNLQKKYGIDSLKLFGPYDFRILEDTQRLIELLKDFKFDSIVCSAGMFSENDDFFNFDLKEFASVMNCNFYSPMLLTIGLKDNINSGGSIIIMSSNDAYSGAYTSMSYSISKSALISLMKCLCVNFGKNNIRVNSVAPGAIDTDMNTPEQMELSPLYTPLSRVGSTSEVASVIYFLASSNSSFINGENITIDGGYKDMSILLKSEADSSRR